MIKKIKIFLASSNELSKEREQFILFIARLNAVLSNRNFEFEPVIWEWINSSYESTRKQDEYNENLKKCQLAVCLFATKLGIYTLEEFDCACKELRNQAELRKLYIFFKEDQVTHENISSDLLTFKESFGKKYQHFYSTFISSDTLLLNLLLEILRYLSEYHNLSFPAVIQSTQFRSFLSEYDFQEVPVFGKNPELQNIAEEIAFLENLLHTPNLSVDTQMKTQHKLETAYEKFHSIKRTILEQAYEIWTIEASHNLATFKQVKQLWISGETENAKKLLNNFHFNISAQSALEKYKASKRQLDNDLLLLKESVEVYKIKALITYQDYSILHEHKRISKAIDCYNDAEELIENIDDLASAKISLAFSYGKFLFSCNRISNAQIKFENALQILDTEAMTQELIIEKIRICNHLGQITYRLGNHIKASRYFSSAVKLASSFDELSSDIIEDIVVNLVNLSEVELQNLNFSKGYEILAQATKLLDNEKLQLSLEYLIYQCKILEARLDMESGKIESAICKFMDILPFLCQKLTGKGNHISAYIQQTLLAMGALASCYLKNKELTKAIDLYKQCLITRKQLSEKSPNEYSLQVFNIELNIGCAYQEDEQPEMAEIHLHSALKGFCSLQVTEPNLYHWEIALAASNLSKVYLSLKKNKQALKTSKIAISSLQRIDILNSRQIILLMHESHRIAQIFKENNQFEESILYYKILLDTYKVYFKYLDHVNYKIFLFDMIEINNIIGLQFNNLDQPEIALKYYKKSLYYARVIYYLYTRNFHDELIKKLSPIIANLILLHLDSLNTKFLICKPLFNILIHDKKVDIFVKRNLPPIGFINNLLLERNPNTKYNMDYINY